MLFSKAIQIKVLVDSFNQKRWESGYGFIEFKCNMFADGKWAIVLVAHDIKSFFSFEIEKLFVLYLDGGFDMSVYTYNDMPVIDLQ